MKHFDEPFEPLSPEGLARRERMRAELQAALSRRRRTRIAVRTGAVASALLLAILVVRPSQPSRTLPPPPVYPAAPACAFTTLVRTDPGILKRFSVSPPVRLEDYLIGDETLLKELAEAGRPTGLIRVNGQTFLADEIRMP